MSKYTIERMIDNLIAACFSWIKPGNDNNLLFIDPLDGCEISAHYGATHAAASLILYGEKQNRQDISDKGYLLLDSVIERWDVSSKLPGFHHDFNNFALCVIDDHLTIDKKVLSESIRKVVMQTPDSNNPTTNWFPMRCYVNLKRAEWSGDVSFRKRAQSCCNNIKKATYEDGFIDDRIPVGLSFNLQYDVATVAVMQFLRCNGVEINISKELGALLAAVAPDGDINYLGRGTNQVFAWGLWIYLLASSGRGEELSIAVDYLGSRLPAMLYNHNMMLNDWSGEEKFMWWDYHYCSVYTAHVLFWLLLAEEDKDKNIIVPAEYKEAGSGVSIYNDGKFFVVSFSGRKEYLSEKGPAIYAIGINGKMICKGGFGPWQGMFGNKYSSADITLKNYCGLLAVKQNVDYSKNRIMRLLPFNIKKIETETITPTFSTVSFEITDNTLTLHWDSNIRGNRCLNIPLYDFMGKLTLYVDGKATPVKETMRIRNQYDWCSIYQSNCLEGTDWKLQIDDVSMRY